MIEFHVCFLSTRVESREKRTKNALENEVEETQCIFIADTTGKKFHK